MPWSPGASRYCISWARTVPIPTSWTPTPASSPADRLLYDGTAGDAALAVRRRLGIVTFAPLPQHGISSTIPEINQPLEETLMSISQSLLPEFDQEMAGTRRVLERVPADKFSWGPHDKSMNFGRLAVHLAELPSWTTMTLNTSELDFAATPYAPTQVENDRGPAEDFRQGRRRGPGDPRRRQRRGTLQDTGRSATATRCSSRCRKSPCCAASS